MQSLGRWQFVLLCSVAVLASGGQVLKYAGSFAGSVLLLAYAMFLIFGGFRYLTHACERLHSKTCLGFGLVLAVGLSAVAVTLYPLANTHEPGRGSDNDDALLTGTQLLVSGGNPYDCITYLGNPPATLPASFLLATPFAIIGHVELQNVFWVLFFSSLVTLRSRNRNPLEIFCGLFLLGGIIFWQQMVTGSDRVANALFVVSAVWLVFRTLQNASQQKSALYLASAGLGFVLATRINMAVVLCPILFHVIANKKSRHLPFCAMAVCAGFVAAFIPVWPEDLASFEPLVIALSKMRRHTDVSGSVRFAFLGTAIGVIFATSYFASRKGEPSVFWAMAISIAAPFLSLTCIASLHTGTLYTEYMDYLILSLPFSLAALFVQPTIDAAPRGLEPPSNQPTDVSRTVTSRQAA